MHKLVHVCAGEEAGTCNRFCAGEGQEVHSELSALLHQPVAESFRRDGDAVERWLLRERRMPACAHNVGFLAVPAGDYGNGSGVVAEVVRAAAGDRKSTRLNSSHVAISYAV